MMRIMKKNYHYQLFVPIRLSILGFDYKSKKHIRANWMIWNCYALIDCIEIAWDWFYISRIAWVLNRSGANVWGAPLQQLRITNFLFERSSYTIVDQNSMNFSICDSVPLNLSLLPSWQQTQLILYWPMQIDPLFCLSWHDCLDPTRIDSGFWILWFDHWWMGYCYD